MISASGSAWKEHIPTVFLQRDPTLARVPNLLSFLPTPTGPQLRMATEQVGTEGLREAGKEEIGGPWGGVVFPRTLF